MDFNLKKLTCFLDRVRRPISILTVLAVPLYFSSGVAHTQDRIHTFEELPYFVDAETLPFKPLAGARALWGVSPRGAGYQIEVPTEWNGGLLVSLRGNGTRCNAETGAGCALEIYPNQLRDHVIKQGFAWATTTYSDFRLFPEEHAADAVELLEIFKSKVSEPTRSYVWGRSFGGVATLAVTQLYPDLFDGALPACTGVVQNGFRSYFDMIFVAMSLVADEDELVAQYLAGFSFPIDQQYYQETIAPRVLAGLGENFPRNSNAKGAALRSFVRANTGGERPMFDAGFDALARTMIIYYLGIADPIDSGGKSSIQNRDIQYRFETVPGQPMSTAEVALNGRIPRFDCDPSICVGPKRQARKGGINGGLTRISGELEAPTLHLQELGDLTAPFSGAIAFAERVKENGKSQYLVQRAVRSAFHCKFNNSELSKAFDDLVSWVETYRRPKGDNFLSTEEVADPAFGCEFTSEPHKLDRGFESLCTDED